MKNKIKMLVVAPYEGLVNLIHVLVKEREDIEVHTLVGDMLEGLELVKAEDLSQYDLVISRAGTADLIREITDLPVIDIKISILDMMRAIKLAENYSGKFAIVGFKSITEQASIINQLNNYNIRINTVSKMSEIDDCLNELKEGGVSMIVGDMITTKQAKIFGLNTILVTSGMESVRNALFEAVKLHEYLRESKKKHEIMQRIHEQLDRMVISFGADREVIYSNVGDREDAGEVLRIAKELQDVLIHDKYVRVMKTIGETQYLMEGKLIPFQGENYPTFYIENQPFVLNPNDKSVTYKNATDSPQVKFEAFPTSNPDFKNVVSVAAAYSETKTPILIYGDKGSGKNILAHAIYQNSQLRKNPMVLIDSKYMNESKWTSILESDNSPFLKKGFTIYIRNLHFLDEKSQRLLELYLSNTNVHKRNRLIFSCISGYASSFDESSLLQFIKTEMAALPLVLPNLNQRKEDVSSLVSLFLSELNPKYGKQVLGLHPEGLELLREFHWTYHIEQLRKVMEALIVLADDFYIDAKDVKSVLANERLPKSGLKTSFINLDKTLDEINQDIIEFVLSDENYNYSKAAKRLGISRSTLWRKVK